MLFTDVWQNYCLSIRICSFLSYNRISVGHIAAQLHLISLPSLQWGVYMWHSLPQWHGVESLCHFDVLFLKLPTHASQCPSALPGAGMAVITAILEVMCQKWQSFPQPEFLDGVDPWKPTVSTLTENYISLVFEPLCVVCYSNLTCYN